MILIDVHKRDVRRHKRHCKNKHRTLLQQSLNDPLSKADPNSLQQLEQLEQLEDIEADRNSFTDQVTFVNKTFSAVQLESDYQILKYWKKSEYYFGRAVVNQGLRICMCTCTCFMHVSPIRI